MTRNRRPKGTGSLYQRADGYWVGAHWVTGDTGGRKRVTVGDWEYDVAEAKLDALVGGEKLPANLEELREVKAEAWDEGAEAAWAGDTPEDYAANPYRTTNENDEKGNQ